MKIIFHTFDLNLRGTAVAVFDYAKYNQEILGNESIILYKKTSTYEKDVSTENSSLEFFQKHFEVRSYANDLEIESVVSDCDVCYFIKYGYNDSFLPTNTKTLIHAVFQAKDPHGDRYAYISDWLSKEMGGEIPFVPHIVDLPKPNEDYRERFKLSNDSLVIGRYGGYYTFDLPFVKEQIGEILESDKRITFLFVNTKPFIKHERVRYIDSIVDRQKKSNFINTCDAMLHARARGESFGLSVCEFLFHNKPVFAWEGGVDRNHVQLLSQHGTLYNQYNLKDKILQLEEYKNKQWSSIVTQFQPSSVMKKFKEVFLNE